MESRLYRFGLLLALAAAVVLMFSVVSRPEPLRSDVAADAFDEASAFALAKRVGQVGPDRRPGGGGDQAAAAFVAKRFRLIQGGSVSVQRFAGSFDGDDVSMRNVILVLPGLSDRTIVVTAPRDCAAGTCAASSGAATGALLELASTFDGAPHQKTLMFVSTDGTAAGAAGAKALARQLEEQPPEGVVVLSQPAARDPRHPFVIPWSSGPQSTSIQLIETARAAVSSELAGGDPLELRTLPSLFRLALPSGLLEQAVLIEHGQDAIGLSAGGDRPLSEAQARGPIDVAGLGAFGRAALTVVFALDDLPQPLDHGPDAYLPLAGKLIPGWALALLALALLVPVGLVSVDGLARASRAREPVLGSLLWTLGRAAPALAVLLLAYALARAGVIPRPAFPYDPQSHPFGVGPALALFALAAAFAGGVLAIRALRPPGGGAEATAPSIGLLIFLTVLAVWIVNPFLALILVPTAHLWLAAALPELRRVPLLVLAALLLGLALPLLAAAYLGSALGVGLGVIWQLVLMFTGGQIGLVLATALALLSGCLVAIVELAVTRRTAGPVPRPGPRAMARHRGPGALGGPPSKAVGGHKF